MSDPGLQRETLDEMFSVAYEELRRLAASVRRDEPGYVRAETEHIPFRRPEFSPLPVSTSSASRPAPCARS